MKTLLSLTFAVAISCYSFLAHAQQNTWEPPYRGNDPALLYLPDTSATYWRYGWKRKPGDKSGLVIKGKLPDARYFSYNIYDDNTKSTVGSYTDFEITLDDGTANLFSGKVGNPHSDYSILVLPEGTKVDAPNVLFFPDSLTDVSVFLRHYVPSGGIQGNVPMPNISRYDPKSKKTSAASPSDRVPTLSRQEAEKYMIPMLNHMIAEFEEDPDKLIEKIHSSRSGKPLNMKELIASQVVAKAFKLFKPGERQYSLRLQTAGTYPNHDNFYLALPVVRKKDQSLLVRFKVPKTPSSARDNDSTQVRYFSLSQGDEFSYTHETVIDDEMKIDSDGFANFIIGENTPQMEEKAKKLGVNFMPWYTNDKMLLIYRHLLPSKIFAHGIDKVASYNPKHPASDQLAIKTIGPYALIGKLLPTKGVLELSKFPKF